MPDSRKYADRAEYLKKAVSKRRKLLKAKVVQYKGGKCIHCSYSNCVDALDLHHVDASTKEFGISSGGLTRSWEKIRLEADKCILVCANCHREIHAGIIKVQPVLVTKQ